MIETAIPCVNYGDFLWLTLQSNLRRLAKVTVLTSREDTAVIELARSCGVALHVTDAWGAGHFNKARALNEWLDQVLSTASEETWCLTLDADILLPPGPPLETLSLDPLILYGARRRMCDDESDWHECVNSRRSLESFPLDIPPVWNGQVWNLPTANQAALYGCFQLWNPQISGIGQFPESPTAAEYDVAFALKFTERHRQFLPNLDILHLGEPRINWQGRLSRQWGKHGEQKRS